MSSFLALLLFVQAAQAQQKPNLTPAPPPYDAALEVKRVTHPEGLAFFSDRDAQRDVENAISRAKQENKIAVIILGANWCHDSVSLAGWVDTPRFMDMMFDRYVLVFVDVGVPQDGRGRNLDIAKRFGIDKVKNTPLLLMVSGDGARLNSKKDAISWRNAAGRSGDAIYNYFDNFGSRQRY